MNELVKVELSVSAETAAVLQNEEHRQVAARIVEEVMRPKEKDPLMRAMDAMAAEAKAAGLTEEDIEAELAAHKIERRR